MTKRLLSLFLVCILAIPILGIPVYASGWDAGDSATLEEIEADTDYIPIMWDVWQDFFDSWDGMFANIEYYTSHIKADLRLFYEKWYEWKDDLLDHIVTSLTNFRLDITNTWQTFHNDLLAKLGARFDGVTNTWQTLHNDIVGKLGVWFNGVTNSIDSIKTLLSGTQEDLEDSELAEDKTDSQTGQLEDIGQELETQPVIDSENIDLWFGTGDTLLSQTDALYFQLIASILEELADFIVLSFVLALCGYILYGKRI